MRPPRLSSPQVPGRPACVAGTGVPRAASQLGASRARPALLSVAPEAPGYTCPATRLAHAQRAPRSSKQPQAAGSAGSGRPGPRGGRGAACALPRAAGQPRRPRGASMRLWPAREPLPPPGQPDSSSSLAASTCAAGARRSRSRWGAGKEASGPLDLLVPGRTPATGPAPSATSRAPENAARAGSAQAPPGAPLFSGLSASLGAGRFFQRRSEGKFGQPYPDCRLRQRRPAAPGHNWRPGILPDDSPERSRPRPRSRRRAEVTARELRLWMWGRP